MRKIGIRELKNQATQVVRAVREEGVEYIITVQGEPVALLRPISDTDRTQARMEDLRQELAELDVLSEEIAADWTGTQTPREVLAAQRASK